MTSTFPVCGPDCLKEKQLTDLKAAMDADPGNKQAQTDYYTALNGQGWLHDQKETTAKTEVEPVLTAYRNQYDALTAQLKTQAQYSSLASALKSDGGTPFLVKDYDAEKSKADVLNRLWILAGHPVTGLDLEGIILYILIALLGVTVVGLAFVKYRKYTSPPTILGGNRLRTK
jgi:hypothetical protein